MVGWSGVSSASALSAGEDSAPETSDKNSWSNDFRGVVKEGLRNCGAGVDDAAVKELFGGGDSKPPGQGISTLSSICIQLLKLTVSLIWLELRKWRLGISWAFSLPFPVHRTFSCTSFTIDITEHGAIVDESYGRANWRKDLRSLVKVNKHGCLGCKG